MLRDFRRDDQAAVEAVINEGMRDRWGDAYDASFNPDITDVWAHHVEQGATVVVVERDGAVVATGALRVEATAVGRLVRMSVAASHRRQGLARLVVAELVDRARRRGMRRVVVRTDTPWTDAVALYRSCGFVVVARDDAETDLVLDLGR